MHDHPFRAAPVARAAGHLEFEALISDMSAQFMAVFLFTAGDAHPLSLQVCGCF